MEDETELGEIEYDELEEEEVEVPLLATPKRIFLIMLFPDPANTAGEILEGLIDEAEDRGLFFEIGTISEMSIEEVAKGSRLHQAITGLEHPR
jgi:hypothetical protein